MNAYTTKGRARIRQRDIDAILHSDAFLIADALAVLERQREGQAEAELDRLLKQHAVKTNAATSHVLLLRQTMGAALVRAGERLAGVPRRGLTPDAAPAAGTLGTAG